MSARLELSVRRRWCSDAQGASVLNHHGGPSSFNGIVDGGTAAYRNARGDFQAIALANGDLSITARLTH